MSSKSDAAVDDENDDLRAGVMHVSNDVIAADAENRRHSNEARSASVKCELKMEIDDEKEWADERQTGPQCHSTLHTPGEQYDIGLRRVGRGEFQSILGTASSDTCTSRVQTDDESYPVSRLTKSARSFPDGLQCLNTKEFRNAARSDVQTDKSGQESHRVFRFEASRPYQKEPQNFDVRKDWKEFEFQSSSTGDVRIGQRAGPPGQTNGTTIVGHQAGSRDRSDELILSTPFGTFHRAPLSFWPARTAGEHSVSSSYHNGTAVDAASTFSINTKVCNQDHALTDERGTLFSSRNVTAKGSESRMPRKVVICLLYTSDAADE